MVDSPIPQSVLKASGIVGSWSYDHWAGRLSFSGGCPVPLGLDPVAAADGVSLETFLDRIHPDDRTRIENYLYAAASAGWPVEAEFRTCESPAGSRILMLRGRIDREAAGEAARGCGIVIDRTEEQARLLSRSEQVVNRMAEQVIALRFLAQSLQRPTLMEQVERLMMEIGFELARHLPELNAEDELRH